MTNVSKDYKSKELIIVLLRTTKLKIKVGGSNPTNTKVRTKFLTMTHFAPTKTTASAPDTARLFFDHVF